jgi:N-methylhydantoinase A/oxoprolinase/acetone carboxylase beta subunit
MTKTHARYIIGLDTGGTFTDAAIIDADRGVLIAKSKSPTTRHDLSIGLSKATAAVVEMLPAKKRGFIERVCLSTTLATNAVVEGMGSRVGLVMIGFGEKALERNGLGKSLKGDPVAFIDGGHHSDAKPQAALSIPALDAFVSDHGKDISAIAIAGHFATRNPEHEIAARDYLREKTGLPITCSHELSSSLGGPKRALTALLNARLIDLLDQQISAMVEIIANTKLKADLMVVKGDGSLVNAEFARLRPVETILSGPAASLSGAAHLVGHKTALVADIGGTTTDIAILEDGYPQLSIDGASVGGWTTMVEAADIRTKGLGGDSETRLIDLGITGGVLLGPRRVIPLSVLATEHPNIKDKLDEQLQSPVPASTDARFVIPLFSGKAPTWLTRSEQKMAALCLEKGVCPIADLAQTSLALGGIDRLVSRGLVTLSAFTPSDAALILNKFDTYDRDAAIKGAELMARQRNGAGNPQAQDATHFADMVLKCLTVQSALALMDSAFAYDGLGENVASKNTILEKLIIDTTSSHHDGIHNSSIVSTSMKLEFPIIALGASAACHYPPVAAAIGAKLIVPEDADVAGAVGAAAGRIRQRAVITVTQPSENIFRVHLLDGPKDFSAMDTALDFAEDIARAEAQAKAEAAGGRGIVVEAERQVNTAGLKPDKDIFVEATITGIATATAR